MRIDELIWDNWNVEHIADHGVEPEEVEEVCISRRRLVLRIGLSKRGLKRYQLFGPTDSGRLLTIILDRVQPGQFYVVTARDMAEREKKRYRREQK